MKARNLNGYVKKVIGGKQDLMTSNTASRWRGRKNSFARVNGPPHTPVSPRYSFEISAKSVASRLCLDHPATGRTLHLARNLILQRSAFAFSCGEQFTAVRVDARLASGLADGSPGFFLKQHREHQQGIKCHPCQCRRLVGRVPQRSVQLRFGGARQLRRQQPLFKPLKLRFLKCAEGSRRPVLRSRA